MLLDRPPDGLVGTLAIPVREDGLDVAPVPARQAHDQAVSPRIADPLDRRAARGARRRLRGGCSLDDLQPVELAAETDGRAIPNAAAGGHLGPLPISIPKMA